MIQHYSLAGKIGKILATRQSAAALRDILVQSKVPLVLDFSGVDLITEIFAEIAFGEAAKILGRERFHLKVTLKDLALNDRVMVFNALEAAFSKK